MKEALASSLYYVYELRRNLRTGRWEIHWRDRRIEEDFATQAEAEEWIDEQIPLNR